MTYAMSLTSKIGRQPRIDTGDMQRNRHYRVNKVLLRGTSHVMGKETKQRGGDLAALALHDSRHSPIGCTTERIVRRQSRWTGDKAPRKGETLPLMGPGWLIGSTYHAAPDPPSCACCLLSRTSNDRTCSLALYYSFQYVGEDNGKRTSLETCIFASGNLSWNLHHEEQKKEEDVATRRGVGRLKRFHGESKAAWCTIPPRPGVR